MLFHRKKNEAEVPAAPEMLQVSCPICQVTVSFNEGDTALTCPSCGQTFNPTAELNRVNAIGATQGDNMNIRCSCTNPEQLVWKHPLESFPIGAMLVAAPGMTAVCVQGNQCKLLVDGESKILSESVLANNAFSFNGGEAQVFMNIYYVRKQLDAKIFWGGRPTVTTAGEAVAVAFPMNGYSVIKEIANPFRFLDWAGYGACYASDFEDSDQQMGRLAELLHPMLCDAMGVALYEAMRQYKYSPQALPAHKDDVIRDLFQEQANERLKETGLKVANTRIEGIGNGVTEVIDVLQYRVERDFEWQTSEVPVHLKDQLALSASLIIGGHGRLRIDDASRISTTDRIRWEAPDAGDDVVAREIGKTIGNTFTSLLPQIIQGMINNVNPPFSELPQFLGYIGTTVESYLNGESGPLKRLGLRAENITAAIRQTYKSAALQQKEASINEIASTDIAEEMRRYAQNITIVRERETSEFQIQMRDIQEKLKEDDLVRAQNAARRDKTRQDMEAQAALEGIQRDETVSDATRQAEQKKVEAEMDWRARVKEREFAELYADWKRKNRMEEEALQAQIRENQAKQEANFSVQQAAMEQKQTLRKIVREIEESDLGWQEKLDAYARLKQQNEFSDAQTRAQSTAELENSVMYNTECTKLRISEEASALMAQLAKEKAEREEEARQAQFARDMEMKRFELTQEVERFNRQREEARQAREAEAQNKAHEAEIEKLRLMLSYQLQASGQQLDHARQQKEMEALRLKAEEEYTRRHEQEAQARRDREAADQRQRDERTTERAERLLKDLMETQKALDTLRLQNERAYNYGRACVDQAHAGAVNEQRVAEIQKTLTDLLDEMHQKKASKDEVAQGAVWQTIMPVQAQQPAYTPYAQQPQPGFQPGVSAPQAAVCPFCGNANPPYTMICLKCQKPIH